MNWRSDSIVRYRSHCPFTFQQRVASCQSTPCAHWQGHDHNWHKFRAWYEQLGVLSIQENVAQKQRLFCKKKKKKKKKKSEGRTRVEPRTSWSAVKCSTTELYAHFCASACHRESCLNLEKLNVNSNWYTTVKSQIFVPYENFFLFWGPWMSFCFEALKSTKISSHEPVSSQKFENINGCRTKICDFTVKKKVRKKSFRENSIELAQKDCRMLFLIRLENIESRGCLSDTTKAISCFQTGSPKERVVNKKKFPRRLRKW